MDQNGERDQRVRELCDAVMQIFHCDMSCVETYLTHAFFIDTIRRNRLSGVTMDQVAARGLSVYPVWMIQSRKSATFLLQGAIAPFEDIEMLVQKARVYSPNLESCTFLTESDFGEFVRLVQKATDTHLVSYLITPSQTIPNVHGCIYPDRAFTIIRYATQPIEISMQEVEPPQGLAPAS